MSKLKSEQNTCAVEAEVLEAARQKFRFQPGDRYRAVFEHDHWWLIVDYHGGDLETRSYDVVDARPGVGTTGLDFEEL